MMKFAKPLVALAVGLAAATTPFTPATAANYSAGTSTIAGTSFSGSPPDQHFARGSAPVRASSSSASSGTNPGPGSRGSASANANATASASVGAVHASAFAQGSGSQATGAAAADASASFGDSFFIRSASVANGTIGNFVARVSFHGSDSGIIHGPGFNNAFSSWNGTISTSGSPSLTISSANRGFGIYTIAGSAIFGAVHGVGINVFAYASVNAENAGRSAFADLGNTVSWEGIQSLTVNGLEITDFSAISADTGFNYRYGFTQAAVPEPASWALMIAGFGLVGSAMRRRAKVLFVTA